MSCCIWTEFLRCLLQTKNVNDAISYVEGIDYSQWFSEEELSFVTKKQIRALKEEDIGETGYVVDTLKTAFYSMCHGHDFASTIRIAVDMGYDTDTSAADSTDPTKYDWVKIKGETGASVTGLAWKVNANNFNNEGSSSGYGECYFHGYDDNGEPADVNGWVMWNGQK